MFLSRAFRFSLQLQSHVELKKIYLVRVYDFHYLIFKILGENIHRYQTSFLYSDYLAIFFRAHDISRCRTYINLHNYIKIKTLHLFNMCIRKV